MAGSECVLFPRRSDLSSSVVVSTKRNVMFFDLLSTLSDRVAVDLSRSSFLFFHFLFCYICKFLSRIAITS